MPVGCVCDITVSLVSPPCSADWPVHQILSGHRGPVTALLYPHLSHARYQVGHLVSGGEDFSVCLWDLVSGALLHRFVVQAGIVLQLHVPPHTVSVREAPGEGF